MDTAVLERIVWGNTVLSYLYALIIVAGAGIVLRIFEAILLARLKAFADKTRTSIDNFFVVILRKHLVPLGYFVALFFGIKTLALNGSLEKALHIGITAVMVFFAAGFLTSLLGYGFRVYWRRRGKDIEIEGSLNGLLRTLSFIVWALAVVLFLDNMGIKISAVIAGLGIGGVAVALAAQTVLGDLFSYFSILFDRPFEIGDFIIVGDYLGTVEHIGIKTTRIASLSGEQLIFSNSDLTNSRVRNYKRMEKRRVLFRLGVVYGTTTEQVKEIPGIIQEVIKGIEDTVFDRAHFLSFADFSLLYEIVYYVVGSDYNKYMDIQQKINFAIKEEFEKRGIEFAYPTQTLYVNKDSEK